MPNRPLGQEQNIIKLKGTSPSRPRAKLWYYLSLPECKKFDPFSCCCMKCEMLKIPFMRPLAMPLPLGQVWKIEILRTYYEEKEKTVIIIDKLVKIF